MTALICRRSNFCAVVCCKFSQKFMVEVAYSNCVSESCSKAGLKFKPLLDCMLKRRAGEMQEGEIGAITPSKKLFLSILCWTVPWVSGSVQ